MKNRLFIGCLVLLTVSLAACGGAASSAGAPPTAEPTPALQEETPTLSAAQPATQADYALGDILLNDDGTLLSPALLGALEEGNPPIAVIALAQTDGGALALGIHHSGAPLVWAADTDGISSAVDFATQYGQTYNLTDAYAEGWRLPEIEELTAIYENREVINAALQTIYALDSDAASNGLGTNWYWASTPATQEGYAWFTHFFNGYTAECPQDFTNLHALAVRTL